MKSIQIPLWRLFCVLLATGVILAFWKEAIAMAFLMPILAIAINIPSSRMEICFYLVAGVLATVVESVSILTGAWEYSQKDIGNIPFWLPLYWGMGALVMKDSYELIAQIVEKRPSVQ